MCGIFGIVTAPTLNIDEHTLSRVVKSLYLHSETRGMESAGISYDNGTSIHCYKQNVSASVFINDHNFDLVMKNSYTKDNYNAVIAHARMVTHGTSGDNRNNQPIVKCGLVSIHNGIITNSDDIWDKYQNSITKELEVDSELIPTLFRHHMGENHSFGLAVTNLFRDTKGAISTATLFKDYQKLLLATNTGSVYFMTNVENTLFIFASEKTILNKIFKKFRSKLNLNERSISQLCAFNALFLDLESTSYEIINIGQEPKKSILPVDNDKTIIDLTEYKKAILRKATTNASSIDSYLEDNSASISQISRCSRCLLPATFPFIHYDLSRICNYCHNYRRKNTRNDRRKEFEDHLESFRRANSKEPNCIVALSGGRDSTYGLDMIKKEFKMNPITFTYDWGMVTDIARNNIANICGELGVENILVSANIPQKRQFIKKNVTAWLKKPDLGIIPLFMAGDKFFFKYVNMVKKETGINLDIWSANHYENTDFKTGFCGVPPQFDKKAVDSLGGLGRFKMPLYYMNQFAKNPSYLNASLVDTIGAYWSYYYEPRNGFCLMFDYIPWVEEAVDKKLINDYGWKPSPDTNSTWRIGDGTAAFYNYIYYTVAGFSEFDTFRSNQIREGVITREEGLQKIKLENRPNRDGIKWYCEVIGLNVESTLKAINHIPKLYQRD